MGMRMTMKGFRVSPSRHGDDEEIQNVSQWGMGTTMKGFRVYPSRHGDDDEGIQSVSQWAWG